MTKYEREVIFSVSPLPVRWFRFYVFVRFPIAIFLMCVELVSVLQDISFSSLVTTNIAVNVYSIIFLAAVQIVFALLVMYYMRNLHPLGYFLNRYYLLFECICVALTQMSKIEDPVNSQIVFALSIPFWFLIFVLPNIIYFRKRQYLFFRDVGFPTQYESVPAPQESNVEQVNQDNVKIAVVCENCGAISDEEELYCKNCGVRI